MPAKDAARDDEDAQPEQPIAIEAVAHRLVGVEEHGDGPTSLAIGISCATTVLSFGLLAASSAPPLRAIGLTVGIGVALSLLLAPAPLAFTGPASPPPSPGGAVPAGEPDRVEA